MRGKAPNRSIALPDLQRLVLATHERTPVGAERDRTGPFVSPFAVAPQHEAGGTTPQEAQREKADSGAVLPLQAGQGIGQGLTRVLLRVALGQREELLGSRPLRAGHGTAFGGAALDPEPAHHRHHGEKEDEGRRQGQAEPLPAPARVVDGGPRKRLFDRRETARVAVPPEKKLLQRGARPEEVGRPPPVVPEPRGLAQLVPKVCALGILGLPLHEARPGGEQRFVDDLDAAPSARVPIRRGKLEGREQPRIDELSQHARRFLLPFREDGEQLVLIEDRPRTLGGDQVPEHLAHDGRPRGADRLQGRLGVLGQRTGHAAALLIGASGQQSSLAIPRVHADLP